MERSTLKGLAVLMLGAFIGVYHSVSLNVTLPAFGSIFSADVSSVQWLVTGFVLASGFAIPLCGYLGERFTYRRLFAISLIGLTVASLLCGFAWNLASLIVFRVIQGLFCGLIQPVALTLLYLWTPPHQQMQALSRWSAAAVVATAIAPSVSGALQDMYWPLIFWVTVLPGALAIIALRKLDRPEHRQAVPPLDWLSLAMASGGSTALLILAGNLHRWPLGSLYSILLLVGGVLLLFGFVLRAWRDDRPLLNLRLFSLRRFGGSVGASVLLMIGLFAGTYFLPLYLRIAHHLSSFEIALLFLPGAFCLMACTLLSGPLQQRIGAFWLIVTGVMIIALGTVAFASLQADTSLSWIVAWICIRNIGIGLTLSPLTNVGMQAVADSQTGHASALLHWLRQVFGAIGLGVLTSYFTDRIQQLGEEVAGKEVSVYVAGINDTFWITTLIMVLVLPLVHVVRNTKHKCPNHP